MNQNAKYVGLGAIALLIGFALGRQEMKYEIVTSISNAMANFGAVTPSATPSTPSVADTEAVKAKAIEAAKKTESADYAKNHLQVYEFQSKVYDSLLDGKVPGVEFKVKNNGDRTVTKLCVTVYFQDGAGSNIAEEEFCPILEHSYSMNDHGPLKPGYVWQQERGHFYSAKRVPSEWKAGAATAQISDVELAPVSGG